MIARNVRLEILRRAREILSDSSNWTTKHLRRFGPDGAPRYCVLGAIEQASYDVGYATETAQSFRDGDQDKGGYLLGNELSLDTYARERYDRTPWSVNDSFGYEATMRMLDEYIVEVEEGRAREPQ